MLCLVYEVLLRSYTTSLYTYYYYIHYNNNYYYDNYGWICSTDPSLCCPIMINILNYIDNNINNNTNSMGFNPMHTHTHTHTHTQMSIIIIFTSVVYSEYFSVALQYRAP
eukprot:GHVR01077648.1.p2 GENE.GHVR01077648.1~~GHVR01077648.1.p2  ORF type:complete len:110 (+),score=40.44 GHVR01077648.1:1106-1435(+)